MNGILIVPRLQGAMAKFAEGGKLTAKKDLGQYAMTYKNVYVASICIHVNHQQAIKALLEAEAYPGPSVVICYSPCISQVQTLNPKS
jgi:pyruvate-ferredoxin/flavodoxin oxidoreductase